MKKILLLNLLLGLCLISKAQSFAPVGATWYYQSGGFSSATYYPVKLESLKDTLIQGLSCRKLNLGISNVTLVYSDSDKVYLFDNYQQLFVKIYDFSLQTGDTLTYHLSFNGNYIDTSAYIIDSTSVISINGKIKKLQFTHFLYSFNAHHGTYYIGGKIIADIGSCSFLLPQYSQADPLIMGLRCYSDSSFGYYNTGIVAKCDSVVTNVPEESNSQFAITVFPNPATNEIFFNITGLKNYYLFIYNTMGECILQKDLNNDVSRLDIADFKKGIYFYKLSDKFGKLFFGKFVKYQ
jgi:hypothetical protein